MWYKINLVEILREILSIIITFAILYGMLKFFELFEFLHATIFV